MKHIDPTKKMSEKHFCELFEQVPLNEDERARVKSEYWKIYKIMVDHAEVAPQEAWLATKNTFIEREPQIGKRKK